MGRTASSLPRPSADKIERSLAILLISLIGMYGIGTLVSEYAPVVDTAGVVAIHLAVVVAGLFPLTVLGHAVSSRVRTGNMAPRRLKVMIASIALSCLLASLWVSLESASELGSLLIAIATGALLVLVGLIAGRS